MSSSGAHLSLLGSGAAPSFHFFFLLGLFKSPNGDFMVILSYKTIGKW